MAGEYVRWLARDVKPLQKKELTPQEKRRNWWDYHKWHVVLALVCLVFAVDLISDVVHNARNKPDYKIAYVGSTDLPEDTARALETALAALGEDLNGNGNVQVELLEYQIASGGSADPAAMEQQAELAYNNSMLLAMNIEMVDSMIFLLEDPAAFSVNYPVLCHTDGTLPGGETAAPMYYSWSSCPVLTALELGEFEIPGITEALVGDSQTAMSTLFVARRGLWDDARTEFSDGAVRLFETMTEGATP